MSHMAFCMSTAPCGHECGRGDFHGGDCDCYERDCKSSSRYVTLPPRQTTGVVVVSLFGIRKGGLYFHGFTSSGSSTWVNCLGVDAVLWTQRQDADAAVGRIRACPYDKDAEVFPLAATVQQPCRDTATSEER